MPDHRLWAGALSLVLLHAETGCPHSANQAARLLEQLGEHIDVDLTTRQLCERASQRLREPESQHARPA